MTLAPKGTESGLREASWEEALELVSTKLRETWKKDKSRLAFLGQRPAAYYGRLPYREVLEGRSAFQQYRSNARMCMASAVVGFMNVFQTDEPAGCYEDLDNADVFITWGANMAEAHPMLYSRLTAHKLQNESVRHIDITTMKTRTSASADKVCCSARAPIWPLRIALRTTLFRIRNTMLISCATTCSSKWAPKTSATPTRMVTIKATWANRSTKTTACTFEEYAARLADYTPRVHERAFGRFRRGPH